MLSVDILDRIFYFAGIRMILPFQKYIFRKTIKKMLHNISDEELFMNDAIKLIELSDRSHDWDYLSTLSLSDKIIIHYADHLNWVLLQEYKVLSDNIIYRFEDKTDWAKVKNMYNIANILINQICKLDWEDPWYYVRLYSQNYETMIYDDVYEIITKFRRRSDWISNGGRYIGHQEIDRMSRHIATLLNYTVDQETDNYEEITADQARFILSYNANWSIVSHRIIRCDEFLWKFRHLLDWNMISKYSQPTEKSLVKFRNFYNWRLITKYNFNNELVKKYVKKYAHE
jgi:hypothetical protein